MTQPFQGWFWWADLTRVARGLATLGYWQNPFGVLGGVPRVLEMLAAEAVAHPMEHGTNEEFWLGILPFDAGHVWLPKARHKLASLTETFASRKVVKIDVLL